MTALRPSAIALFTAQFVAVSACSASAPTPTGGAPADVVYDGEATDEALLRLLERTPRDVASRRLALDGLGSNVILSSAAPPQFSFHVATGRAELTRSPTSNSGTQRRSSLIGAAARPAAPWFSPRFASELTAVFLPIREAHAHGAPLNGPGFLLVVSDGAGTERLRVFTTHTAYTPPLQLWQAVASEPGTLNLSINWAIFDQNDIPADGGPFIGASASLQIH
jgi:hypothetical protein